MDRFLIGVVLGIVAISHVSLAGAKSEKGMGTQSVATLGSAPIILPALPPLPAGKSTVIGGSIRDVDFVRDQFTLKVFGGHSMKILFDERTHIYRDGIRTSLRDLHPEDHASIKTTLDGTSIFAINIHILSKSPEGECQGQVLNYDRKARVLTISSVLSREQIELRVPTNTPIVRIGQARQDQAASSSSDAASAGFDSLDFVKGTLISAKFVSDNKGRGVVSQIAILATPGSAFVFSGNVISIDLHSELLVLVDPRDDKTYQIFFDPSLFPVSRDIHEGAHVTVTTKFDGVRYVARAITANYTHSPGN